MKKGNNMGTFKKRLWRTILILLIASVSGGVGFYGHWWYSKRKAKKSVLPVYKAMKQKLPVPPGTKILWEQSYIGGARSEERPYFGEGCSVRWNKSVVLDISDSPLLDNSVLHFYLKYFKEQLEKKAGVVIKDGGSACRPADYLVGPPLGECWNSLDQPWLTILEAYGPYMRLSLRASAYDEAIETDRARITPVTFETVSHERRGRVSSTRGRRLLHVRIRFWGHGYSDSCNNIDWD